MSEARLHINLSEGIIEAEGDADFVRQVYADFKAQLGSSPGADADALDTEEEEEEAPPPMKHRRKPKHR